MLEKTLVLHLSLKNDNSESRTNQSQLDEIVNLTKAIDLEVIVSDSVVLNSINISTYIGKGKTEYYAGVIKENEISLAVINTQLSPIQQRNLEKAWQCKVIDRTALIIEIFGQRAKTKEGVLQVELAQLTYQRSRLVRGWTHLERQRGGRGFLGGPGETQIELDKRVITENIVKIKKQLEEVIRTRQLQRKSRKKVPFPVVALVGYTNAGKSTLFNLLTKSNVFAQDLLFATLDPTMRKIRLPSGKNVILSDTVGFISDLPTELIAAFRATLEEVLEADVILHVRDVSHSDTLAQKTDVENVLKSLGIRDKVDRGLIEVLNKVDCLDEYSRKALLVSCSRHQKEYPISALTGEGVNLLLKGIEQALFSEKKKFKFKMYWEKDSAFIAELYQKGQVVHRIDAEDSILLEVYLNEIEKAQLKKSFPKYFIDA